MTELRLALDMHTLSSPSATLVQFAAVGRALAPSAPEVETKRSGYSTASSSSSSESLMFKSAVSRSRALRFTARRSATLRNTGTGMVYSASIVTAVPPSRGSTVYVQVLSIVPML